MNDARMAAALESASAAPAGADADDLAVLAPDVEIRLAGETITVRELSFGEQIRHAGALRAVTSAMKTGLQADKDLTCLLDALAACGTDLLRLAAVAAGKPVEWVEALSGEEGETLLIAFWGANQSFFLRRLVAYPAAAAMARAGAASSPPSSGTATSEAN